MQLVEKLAVQAGARTAVVCSHWEQGGAGALKLAEAVEKICSGPKILSNFLYPIDADIKSKIEIIAKVNINHHFKFSSFLVKI